MVLKKIVDVCIYRIRESNSSNFQISNSVPHWQPSVTHVCYHRCDPRLVLNKQRTQYIYIR